MDKEKLDQILELHQAQPVGDGYIDIIVTRDRYALLIKDLVENEFKITSISWWEWCPTGQECAYGIGGPESKFFEGWFAELPIDVDDISSSADVEYDDVIALLTNTIETKTIKYPDEMVTFEEHRWLTPALWLDVPQEWRNKYGAENALNM